MLDFNRVVQIVDLDLKLIWCLRKITNDSWTSRSSLPDFLRVIYVLHFIFRRVGGSSRNSWTCSSSNT